MLKNKVLFVIYLNSHFSSLFPVAKMLKKSKNFDPVFLFEENYLQTAIGIEEAIKNCKTEKIKIYDFLGKSLKSFKNNKREDNQKKIQQKLHKVYSFFAKISIVDILINPIIWLRFILSRIDRAQNIFQEVDPQIIIFAEENPVYLTTIFSGLARKNNVPSIIIPHTLAKDKEERAEIFYEIGEIKNFSSRLAAKLFPKWSISYKKRKLLMGSFPQILVMELLKLSPDRPWQVNSGFSDKILMESKFVYNYSLKNHFPKEKLIITGSINDDILFNKKKQAEKEKLRKKYNFNNNPILLCALPSDQPGKKTEYSSYYNLLDFWIEKISHLKNYNIIFNIHPNVQVETREYLKQKNLNIEYNTLEAIPSCDLYVASISATIRWAIACGIPVINYDVYGFSYHDYDSAKGVILVNKKKSFERVLEKITTDKKYYQKIKEKQEKSAPDWGMLDGKSGKRIFNLFKKLVNEKTK